MLTRQVCIFPGTIQTFGENACHAEPMRFAQGKFRAGSGSPDTEILSAAKDDSQDTSQVRSREAFSPNVWVQSCTGGSNGRCWQGGSKPPQGGGKPTGRPQGSPLLYTGWSGRSSVEEG